MRKIILIKKNIIKLYKKYLRLKKLTSNVN